MGSIWLFSVVYAEYIRYIAYMKKPVAKTIFRIVLSVAISIGSVLLDRHVAPDLGNAIKESLNTISNEI
jgi:hypothetical protein